VLRQTDPMTMVVLPVLGWGPALCLLVCRAGSPGAVPAARCCRRWCDAVPRQQRAFCLAVGWDERRRNAHARLR
jgi:hypothetical protein